MNKTTQKRRTYRELADFEASLRKMGLFWEAHIAAIMRFFEEGTNPEDFKKITWNHWLLFRFCGRGFLQKLKAAGWLMDPEENQRLHGRGRPLSGSEKDDLAKLKNTRLRLVKREQALHSKQIEIRQEIKKVQGKIGALEAVLHNYK